MRKRYVKKEEGEEIQLSKDKNMLYIKVYSLNVLRTLAVLNKEFKQIEDGLFLKTLSRFLLQCVPISIDLLRP